MVVWQYQEVNGRNDTADAGVEVECPPPGGRALGEGAADDRAQDGADTPPEAREAKVTGAFDFGGVDGEDGEEAHVHACAANARESTADDEGGDVGGTAAEGRCTHE
jgi:hypothetical protein